MPNQIPFSHIFLRISGACCRTKGAWPLQAVCNSSHTVIQCHSCTHDVSVTQLVMFQIQRNDAKYSIRLVDSNLADDGNYTCQVSNKLGTISRTFTVNIVGNVVQFSAAAEKISFGYARNENPSRDILNLEDVFLLLIISRYTSHLCSIFFVIFLPNFRSFRRNFCVCVFGVCIYTEQPNFIFRLRK